MVLAFGTRISPSEPPLPEFGEIPLDIFPFFNHSFGYFRFFSTIPLDIFPLFSIFLLDIFPLFHHWLHPCSSSSRGFPAKLIWLFHEDLDPKASAGAVPCPGSLCSGLGVRARLQLPENSFAFKIPPNSTPPCSDIPRNYLAQQNQEFHRIRCGTRSRM